MKIILSRRLPPESRSQSQTIKPTVILFLVLISVFVDTTKASIVVTPSGVMLGQGYQLAFVTDGVIDALSSDITDYDKFVAAEAMAIPELAALNTSWRAVVSTANVDARLHTNTGATFPNDWLYQLDGSLLYTSFGQGFGYVDEFNVGLNVTPTGAIATGLAWTGSGNGGNANAPLGSANPTLGNVGDTSVFRLDNGTTSSGSLQFRLYAVSGTIIAVPEPSTCGMMTIGGLLLGFVRRAPNRDRRAGSRRRYPRPLSEKADGYKKEELHGTIA